MVAKGMETPSSTASRFSLPFLNLSHNLRAWDELFASQWETNTIKTNKLRDNVVFLTINKLSQKEKGWTKRADKNFYLGH